MHRRRRIAKLLFESRPIRRVLLRQQQHRRTSNKALSRRLAGRPSMPLVPRTRR